MFIKENEEVTDLVNTIINLKENNRLLENGSKQLYEDIKLLIKDREELKLMLGVILESHKKGYSVLTKPIVEKVKELLEQWDTKRIK